MKKKTIALFSFVLILCSNVLNSQISLCIPKEARAIVETLSQFQTEDTIYLDDLIYTDLITKEGFRNLQDAKEVFVLKVYAVLPIKEIDSSIFQTDFFNYFKVDSAVFCYLLFGKDSEGKFYDLGRFNSNYREQRYVYEYHIESDINQFANLILQNSDYIDATLILFWVNKKFLNYLLVKHDVLYGFKMEGNSECGFKSFKDFKMFLKKVYSSY